MLLSGSRESPEGDTIRCGTSGHEGDVRVHDTQYKPPTHQEKLLLCLKILEQAHLSAGEGSISNNNDMSENCELRGPGPPPELELTEAGHEDRRNTIGLCAASGHARTFLCTAGGQGDLLRMETSQTKLKP